MALTTVHFWGNFDITGHVSVDIGNNYMSFHPDHGTRGKLGSWVDDFRGTKGHLVNYSDDRDYSGYPTKSIYINWLDTDAMNERIDYYDYLIERDSLNYQLNTHNCSTLATELLCIGASREFSAIKSIKQLYDSIKRQPFTHDHGRVFEMMRESLEDYSVMCSRPWKNGQINEFFVPCALI